MKKTLISFLSMFFAASNALASEDVVGVWKTIDDETNEPKSLVQIYEYEGKIFGRVIKVFTNPEAKAVGIKNNPKIEGLDIIWNLEKDDDSYSNGKILDPKKGKIYSCEIWVDKEDGALIVRGKIGPFGRNQKWIKEEGVKTLKLKPSIPEKD